MTETLHIHVGIKLSALVAADTDTVVPSDKLSEFFAEVVAFKNAEVAAFKRAVQLVLNIAPTYIFCDVSSTEDGLTVYLSDDFSEEEDGNYNEWLESYQLSEEKLQEDLQHYARVVKNMASCYGRHFNGNLMFNVELVEG